LMEGQALFQVAKDKDRPFVVDTGTATIRAVGTEFDVQLLGTDTTVSVVEGTVAVLSTPARNSSDRKDLMVNAGEQAIVTARASTKPKQPISVSAATAWTRGRLEFDETPLREVADEFNRSSPRPMKLLSATAGSVRISGVYSSVDPESLIIFLRSQPDLEVSESPEQIVIASKLK
jgi:transmembrane sensor